MPKAILEYELPEENDEFTTAINGAKFSSILNDIRNYVRSLRKYEERDSIPTEEFIEKLDELMEEYSD